MAHSGNFHGCTGYTYEFGHKGRGCGPTHAAWALPGGSGSIYPSEYGILTYDQYSGSTGTVYHRDYVIEDVELSDTFESWRVKTNTEIIEKLNNIKVMGATAGDGMMLAIGTGGTLAMAFSGNVIRTHSTFCNHVSIGETLKVDGTAVGSVVAPTTVRGKQDGLTASYRIDEKILVLNTNEPSNVGCDFSGLIVGGKATGPNPESIDKSSGGDKDDTFLYDRPYWLHKNNMWRTKEGLWFEGHLKHNEVFTGLTSGGGNIGNVSVGTTGPDYPYGPYGYTGCFIEDAYKDIDSGPGAGVVRIFFGPTLAENNFLDIDGRGGRSGKTGHIWSGIGGATGALVIGNTAGPLVEFDTDGYVNIVKGANNIRVTKGNHGFVFGNVLRYSGTTQGYTYASAAGDNELHGDNISAAEVVGIVSRVIDHDTFDLAMSGEISGTKSEWNTALIENHTEGLIPGNVYFLSQYGKASRGKLQKEAPHVVGYVNKPVILATGKTSGIILPYRGQMNSSTGCTAGDVSGKSGGEVTTFLRAYDSSAQTFVEGNAVCVDTTTSSNLGLADITDINKSHVLGIVTYVDSTNNYLRIATSGTVTLTQGVLKETGTYYLHENGNLSTTPGSNLSVKVLDALSPTRVVLNIDAPSVVGGQVNDFSGVFRSRTPKLGTELNIKGPTGATGHTYDNIRQVNRNELFNGNFRIWQRGIGTTSAYGGTANTYFADRWLRLGQFATGATNPETGNTGGTKFDVDYKLARGKFDKKETAVQGHPDYYAIIRGGVSYHAGVNHINTHGSTMNNCWYRVEQRIPDATSFAGEVMTISFFARGDNPGNYHCTGDCHVAFIQNLTGTTGDVPGATSNGHSLQSNTGVTASEINTPIADFRVNKTWTPYNFSFFVPELSNAAGASGANHTIGTGVSADHFVSLAFYTQNTNRGITFNHDLHLSQVKLERGNVPTAFTNPDHDEELQRCKRFYQNSYVEGVPVGADTMHSTSVPDTSGINFVVPNSYTHLYELPERMRKTPDCNLWSPQGIANEAFNRDATNSLKNVAGTKGFDGRDRTTRSNSDNISVKTDTPNVIEIKVLGGAVPLDTITVHYEADAEFNNAFPTPIRCH